MTNNGRPTPAGRARPTPGGRSRPTPAGRRPVPKPARSFVGSVPFLFVLAAIVLVGASAVTWVISPNWGGPENVIAAPRNIGRVPTEAGALVPYVSPNRIEIPAIDARAPIVRVGTLPGRELEIPLNPKVVGWWHGGAKPGARKGTAILAGHINYAGVTGELARIGTLDPGDAVYVYGKRQGKEVGLKFLITGVRTYRKTALPYQAIFDQRSVGRLAIVTCGGAFDASTGNYVDNIVAFAVPANVHGGAITPD